MCAELSRARSHRQRPGWQLVAHLCFYCTMLEPRIGPLSPAELERSLQPSAAPGGNGGNLFATVVRNASLYDAWRPFVRRLNAASTLTLRQRELVVLRTAWICRSEYVWGQHVLVATTGGMAAED